MNKESMKGSSLCLERNHSKIQGVLWFILAFCCAVLPELIEVRKEGETRFVGLVSDSAESVVYVVLAIILLCLLSLVALSSSRTGTIAFWPPFLFLIYLSVNFAFFSIPDHLIWKIIVVLVSTSIPMAIQKWWEEKNKKLGEPASQKHQPLTQEPKPDEQASNGEPPHVESRATLVGAFFAGYFVGKAQKD